MSSCRVSLHTECYSSKTHTPILLSNDVLATIRKEIKRKTKHNVDPKDLKDAVECLVGD